MIRSPEILSSAEYFNTTRLQDEELARRKTAVVSQNAEVLRAFQLLGSTTPARIASHLPPSWPLTSIRRAITTLTRQGLLERTRVTTRGRYGALEHFWKITDKGRAA